jgi:hypothetical protein
VAVLLNKEARKSLLEWQPVSERIISTRLKSKVRGDLNAKVKRISIDQQLENLVGILSITTMRSD